MERFLSRLDRRFGRYAPENLIVFIVGLTGILRLVAYARPELLPLFWLDPAAIMHGEVWRVVTFLFAPTAPIGLSGLVLSLMGVWLLHTMGTSLESQWGALRFDLFFLLGGLATLAVGFLLGPVSGFALAAAMFLAFAAEFPEFTINLYMVFPLKVKWLSILTAGALVFWFFSGRLADRAAVAVAVIDLFVFCGATLRDRLRGARSGMARSSRRTQFEGDYGPAPRKTRVCAKCGRSSADDPNLEFRVCDCQDRCGGKLTEYCIDHAKNH